MKSQIPEVSVVMSVRNSASTVQRAVESVLEQSFRQLEVVVVNDGSTDETGAILNALAARDERVRLLHSESSKGLTAALRFGCSQAKGRWIARHDSDEWSESGRISDCLAVAREHERLLMVGCATRYVTMEGEEICVMTRPTDPKEATRRLLDQREGPPAHGCMMFLRSAYEAVGGYRKEFYCAQDSDLWLRLAETGEICYTQNVGYNCVLRAEGISGKLAGVQKRFGELGHLCRRARLVGASETPYLEMADRLSCKVAAGRGRGTERLARSRMACFIGCMLAAKKSKSARLYFVQALRSNPFNVRAFLHLLANTLIK